MSKFVLIALICLSLNCTVAYGQDKLHIAVASNFKEALQHLVVLFQEQALGKSISITTSSASSGVLFAQISNGAPYDLFLSADAERPDELIRADLAVPSTRQVYARGQVVLWAPKQTQPFDVQLLSQSLSGRYTLANPKLAPYGFAAKKLMEKQDLWSEHDASRVLAQNIAGAFQYVASGVVGQGWVAMSQIHSWEKKNEVPEHTYWLPPLSDYEPIEQVAVRLAKARHPDSADLFLAFLSAPKAKTLIESYGYLIPN